MNLPSPSAAQAAALGSSRDAQRADLSAAVLPPVGSDARPKTSRRQVLTVMFVDIRGSSQIEETLSPELTIEFLNIYLGLAAQAIVSNHGGVNQFIGDGVLATFGLLDEPDHGASNALAAAAAIHRAFEDAKGRTGTTQQVRAVVAIHTGTAIVHAVDRAEASHYGVLGSAVNIASRLEWEGKELGLTTVLSGSTVAALKGGAGTLHLVARKKLRGLPNRIEIWTTDPVGHADLVDRRTHSTATSEATDEAWQPATASMRKLNWKPLASPVLIGVFVAGLAGLTDLRWVDGPITNTLMSSAQVAMAIAATITCGWTASRSRLHLRRGWTLIAGSTAMWALGQTQASVLGLGLGFGPLSEGFAGVSFLVSLVLAIAGVLCFWTSPLGPYDRLRAVLDGLIVSASLTFSLWALGLNQVSFSPAFISSELTDGIEFSVGEVVLGTVVILVINRGARHLQGPLLLLLASVAMGATAAVFGAYATTASEGGVYVADAGLLLALVLVAAAPLWPVRRRVLKSEASVDVWQLALPWMAVILAAASGVIVVLHGQGLDRFLTLLAAILAGLLAASQFLAHRDSLTLLHKSLLSESTLAEVIAHAPIGIARVNTELKVVAANPSLGSLLREPPELITGSALVRYLTAGTHDQMCQKLAALASGKAEIVESELPMIRADGNPAWVHLSATAVDKPTGKVDYFLAMIQDTTARHEAEQASRTTLAQLERLNSLKTEFLQSISHEFKTALIGIEGFSELMQQSTDIDADEVREFARDIHTGAERLGRMVSEFLDLDQVENGPATMLLVSVDVNAVIRREVEQAKLGTDGLTFTAMLDPDLPTIVGDEARLSQLVKVLLRNAVRHSPDGGQVIVSTRTHVGQLEVSLMDQGVGVRADFDNPLFRGDDLYVNNPIRRVVGTGLGLGIARQIVALHGGRLWMDRLDGIGSEAHVTLPLDMTASTASARLPAASAEAR